MATRLLEPLNTSLDDPNAVNNWIARLESAIEIALFTNADQLPTDQEQRTVREDSLRKNYLLASIGPAGYECLASHSAPETPSQKTYTQLVELLKNNLAPTRNKIGEEYKFTQLKQDSGELLSSYFGRVRLTANMCDFGDKFDQMVRSRFIYGLKDLNIRKILLAADDKLTAQQAYDKALAKERASASNQTMSSGVNYVRNQNHGNFRNQGPSQHQKNSKPGQKKAVVCASCTLKGHSQSDCKVKCRKCHKIGHLSRNCLTKSKKNVRNVDVCDQDAEEVVQTRNGYDEENSDPEYSVMLHRVDCDVYLDPSDSNPATIVSDVKLDPSDPNTAAIVSAPVLSDVRKLNHVTVHELDNLTKNNLQNSVQNDIKINSSILKVENTKPAITVHLNGKYVQMEIDTGATVSCMSRRVFDNLGLIGYETNKCNVNLCVANGQVVKSFDRVTVHVKFKNSTCKLPLYVVESNFPSLFGVEWIQAMFGADWLTRLVGSTCSVNQVQSRESFISQVKSSKVFEKGMGVVKGFEACIDLKESAKPVFCKFRQPPFAYREAIGAKLDSLEEEGILVRVDSSDYASPIHPIIKDSGEVRICGDYKRTLNPNIDTKVYPLPVIEDCLWEVRGGEVYTKLDIKHAYNHLPIRECDQLLTTINTHKGLYKWTRLPFGVSSASAIFQSAMDKLLVGIPGVVCRVDDILISGKNDIEHMERVLEVLKRLEEAGYRCRLEKSYFMVPKVAYLGHMISKEGCTPIKSKVETLLKAKYPANRNELISFLGAIQYYARYLPNLHSIIDPLNRLRSKGVPWKFEKVEKESFDELKRLMASNHVLTFYSPDLPLKLDTDASAVGLGAVLSHVDHDGAEKPIEFISCTLRPPERNYSQIEREALAIVRAIQKFHRYLYAWKFEFCTDHKPLEMIFDPYKFVSEVVSSRIQRWALFLTSYDYSIKFRPTQKHSNADVCS